MIARKKGGARATPLAGQMARIRTSKTAGDEHAGWMPAEELSQALERAHKFHIESKAGRTSPVLLAGWFRHDTWHFKEAILLLLGLDPSGTVIKMAKRAIPSDDPFDNTIKVIRLAGFLDGRESDYTTYEVEYAALKKANASWEELTSCSRDHPVRNELDELSSTYRDMLAIWESGQYSERAAPSMWIKWAQSKGFDIPWLEWAGKAGLLKPAQEERPLTTKERNNLLKLVLGLAIDSYQYDPTKRSPVPSQIADDLARLGLSIDPDTVRKYLQEAANLHMARPTKSG